MTSFVKTIWVHSGVSGITYNKLGTFYFWLRQMATVKSLYKRRANGLDLKLENLI